MRQSRGETSDEAQCSDDRRFCIIAAGGRVGHGSIQITQPNRSVKTYTDAVMSPNGPRHQGEDNRDADHTRCHGGAWNHGVVWAPVPTDWGSGFWGAFAAGAATAVVMGTIVKGANHQSYTS
jgi:hypothetical protein